MELFVGSALPNHQHSQELGCRAGRIEEQLRRAYRRAARWLGQRPVWVRRASAEAVASRVALVEELTGVQREMLARTGMRVRIGAGRTVTVARTASRAGTNSDLCVVNGGEERVFLAPLPLSSLDGLSGASLEVLRASGLVTIGELQRVPKAALQAELGEVEGLRVWRSARGLDNPRSATAGLAVSGSVRNAEIPKMAAGLPHSKAWGGVLGEMLRRLAF